MAIEYRSEPEYTEYIDGIAHPKVSPRIWHGIVQGAFVAILREQGRGRGVAATEWDCWLPDRERLTKFIPDVSFCSYERLRPLSERDRQFLPFAPDIAVEVLSPGDAPNYLQKKIDLYLSHGSLVVFDADPALRTVRVVTKEGERTLREGDRFADEVVPWFTFDVREVFADLDIPEQ